MKTRLLIIIGMSVAAAMSLSYYATYDSPTTVFILCDPKYEQIDGQCVLLKPEQYCKGWCNQQELSDLGCNESVLDHIYRATGLFDEDFDGTYYYRNHIGLPDKVSAEKFKECTDMILEKRQADKAFKDALSSKYTGFSDVEKLLAENKIDYLQDKLVVTGGTSIRGNPGCGVVVDTDSETYWFGIDSVSNPTKMTLFSENPQQCIVNTDSCFCNAQIELASLTSDELTYFTPAEQEKYSEILTDYLYDQNINKTPKFQIGKSNIDYTDSSAIGYCGHIWGTNTYGFFSGAIVDDVVEDYKIEKELPLLCAISDDAKWWENEN